MTLINGRHPAVDKLCRVLGLPNHVTRFNLRMDVNEIVRCDVEFYPSAKALGEMAKIFQRYGLKVVAEHEATKGIEHASG